MRLEFRRARGSRRTHVGRCFPGLVADQMPKVHELLHQRSFCLEHSEHREHRFHCGFIVGKVFKEK